MTGLRWGMPGKRHDDDRAAGGERRGEAELRGCVECRLLELAVAAEVKAVVEVPGLIEEGAVQPAVGIVVGIGRRVCRVALGCQNRVRVGQRAVGQGARQERVLDVVGPRENDVAVVDDGEARP